MKKLRGQNAVLGAKETADRVMCPCYMYNVRLLLEYFIAFIDSCS